MAGRRVQTVLQSLRLTGSRTWISSSHAATIALTLPQAYALLNSRDNRDQSFSLGRTRCFSSTPIAVRQADRRPRKPKFVQGTKNSQHGHRQNNVEPPNFDRRPPPSRRECIAKAIEALDFVQGDPYILHRLSSLGLQGPVATYLAKVVSAHSSSSDEDGALSATLSAWVLSRKGALTSMPGAAMLGKHDNDAIIEEASHAIESVRGWSAEGPLAKVSMARMHLRDFLAYVKEQLTDLQQRNIHRGGSDTAAGLKEAAKTTLGVLSHFREAVSLRDPPSLMPTTRVLKRQVHLHVGPTNSGKTYHALRRLATANAGWYLGPLRMLAHEVWERINNGKISPDIRARPCNLQTGEEHHVLEAPGEQHRTTMTAATVEMGAKGSPCDVTVIDEIQMIADEGRGHAWTQAFLACRSSEIHLCGEASVLPLIKKLVKDCGDELTIHEYKRLTPLKVARKSLGGSLAGLRPGDCIVTFSRTGIFSLKSRIEEMRPQLADGTLGEPLRCTVTYGNLPPEVKAEQARLFNEGHIDVMIASDVIGMGLNLNIKRLVFETLVKFDGEKQVTLKASQIKQIAGRAGRFGTQQIREGPKYSIPPEEEGVGIVTTLYERQMPILRAALEAPTIPITRANIAPNEDQMLTFAGILPKQPIRLRKDHWLNNGGLLARQNDVPSNGKMLRTTTDFWTDLALFCEVDASSYVLITNSSRVALTPIVLEAASVNLDEEHPRSASSARLRSSAVKSSNPALDTQEPNTRLLLSDREINQFSLAPVKTRDETLVSIFKEYVRAFATRGLVELKPLLQKCDLLTPLEEVEESMRECHKVWMAKQRRLLETGATGGESVAASRGQTVDEASPRTLATESLSMRPPVPGQTSDDGLPPDPRIGEPTIDQLVGALQSGIDEGANTARGQALIPLETFHRSLSDYLWLAMRYPLAFYDVGTAMDYKDRAERAIEFSLRRLRHDRMIRLKQLGRTDMEAERADKSQRRRMNQSLARRGISDPEMYRKGKRSSSSSSSSSSSRGQETRQVPADWKPLSRRASEHQTNR